MAIFYSFALKQTHSPEKPALKTDSIFYRIFQSIPSTFFELINQPPQLAKAYQFSRLRSQTTGI